MTLILRKCYKDGHSRNDFFYGKVGERVAAPDWDPLPICGNGLHGLKEGNGDWNLLEGNDWLIIDADDQVVDIDEFKCKFNTGVILFRGTAEELEKTDFCYKMATKNISAYDWAYYIGNHDIMINRINDSYSAYFWAKYIGNQDVMIDKITNSNAAYYWAKHIGNRDIMIDKVVASWYALCWAKEIGNHDVMINRITTSYEAFCWAKEIGNHDVMINKITESKDAFYWALEIGNHDVMKSKIKESAYIDRWNSIFHSNKIESH